MIVSLFLIRKPNEIVRFAHYGIVYYTILEITIIILIGIFCKIFRQNHSRAYSIVK